MRPEPPAGARFKKGQSGNPKGRPRRGGASISAFDIVIDRMLTVVQNGRAREVTVEEALQHKTYQEAIAGSRSARREVLKMISRREKALLAKQPRQNQFEFRDEHSDPDNANAALLILNIARLDERWTGDTGHYEHLLLEPWAVEAALRRRRTSNLTQKDLSEIRRCTRNPDSIRWPTNADG